MGGARDGSLPGGPSWRTGLAPTTLQTSQGPGGRSDQHYPPPRANHPQVPTDPSGSLRPAAQGSDRQDHDKDAQRHWSCGETMGTWCKQSQTLRGPDAEQRPVCCATSSLELTRLPGVSLRHPPRSLLPTIPKQGSDSCPQSRGPAEAGGSGARRLEARGNSCIWEMGQEAKGSSPTGPRRGCAKPPVGADLCLGWGHP